MTIFVSSTINTFENKPIETFLIRLALAKSTGGPRYLRSYVPQ